MNKSSERALREAFAALHSADTASAPAIEWLLDHGAIERRRHARRLRLRSGSLIIAAVAVLGTIVVRDALQPAPHEIHMTVDLGSVWWHAPSDFLLNTPGRELLAGVPALGATATETVGTSDLGPVKGESTTAIERRSER